MSRRIDFATKKIVKQGQPGARPIKVKSIEEAEIQLATLGSRCDTLDAKAGPDFVDFFNIQVSGTAKVVLPHGLGGSVNFYPIDLVPSGGSLPAFNISRTYPVPESDAKNQELSLDIAYTGTVSIRVERTL